MDISGVDQYTMNYLLALEKVKTAGFIRNYTNINAGNTPYTATVTNSILDCDTSSSALTINLPDTATVTSGFVLTIKDEARNCMTNNIIIDPYLSQTIEGETTLTMNINGKSLTIYTDGSNWFID